MAQSVSGTNLVTNWRAHYAEPAVEVYCDWNMDGDYSDDAENVSAYVLSGTCNIELYDSLVGLPMLGGGRMSSAQVTLSNPNGYFSPDNSSGLAGTYPAVANGLYRVPIIIKAGYVDPTNGAETLRQFTGVIEGYGDSERIGVRQITLNCRGRERLLSQHKVTTNVQSDRRVDQLMATHLAAAGETSTALDRSVSIIDHEWLDDANLLEQLCLLAAADGGWFYYDENGVARYEHATHWLEGSNHINVVATLDEDGTLSITDALTWKDTYKSVVVEYSPIAVGLLATVYQAAKTIVVPPGKSITEKCRFMLVAKSIIAPQAGVDYDACSAGGTNLSGNLSVAVTPYAAQADITLTNTNANHAIYVYGLQLRGFPLVIDEAQEVRASSGLAVIDGEKEYAVRGNDWIQSREQAERVANRMRDLLENPQRLWTWEGPLCPFLEMGDRVNVKNGTQGIDADGYLVGLNVSFRTGDLLRMTARVLPVASVFAEPSYFILGTSNYAATSAPVYY